MIQIARKIYRRVGIPLRKLPTITVKNVRRGRYHRKTHSITLPAWLEKEFPSYIEWYVAHELAHAVSRRRDHGLRFQLTLRRLAPEAWHWESTYKPRAYSQALRYLER